LDRLGHYYPKKIVLFSRSNCIFCSARSAEQNVDIRQRGSAVNL